MKAILLEKRNNSDGQEIPRLLSSPKAHSLSSWQEAATIVNNPKLSFCFFKTCFDHKNSVLWRAHIMKLLIM
jgi:hypothetical protein